MGRLPASFAGIPIMYRIPFIMQTEKDFTTTQSGVAFPEGPVTHGIDKPFEIHRMIPRVTAMTSSIAFYPQPSDDLMEALISITVRDFGKNQSLTKQLTFLSQFVKGSAERTWEFADPYYLKQGDGFEIGGKSEIYTGIDATTLRVKISFEGFLLVLAPPSDQR